MQGRARAPSPIAFRMQVFNVSDCCQNTSELLFKIDNVDNPQRRGWVGAMGGVRAEAPCKLAWTLDDDDEDDDDDDTMMKMKKKSKQD